MSFSLITNPPLPLREGKNLSNGDEDVLDGAIDGGNDGADDEEATRGEGDGALDPKKGTRGSVGNFGDTPGASSLGGSMDREDWRKEEDLKAKGEPMNGEPIKGVPAAAGEAMAGVCAKVGILYSEKGIIICKYNQYFTRKEKKRMNGGDEMEYIPFALLQVMVA